MLDLVLPLQCGGCGAPATAWCASCAQELAVRHDEPHLVTPRLDPGVPVFSLGRYAGARRHALVAAKERGRTDLLGPLGDALHTALGQLLTWGLLDTPLTLIPAPTRRTSARRRGGDPVTRLATHAARGLPGVAVAPSLRLAPFTRDSVGLSSAARQRNIAGCIRLTRGVTAISSDVVVVDDIVTTGATATESVRVLQTRGVAVAAVLALAHA
ncbi:ComF family protein [Mycolicibacterium obuense]|uniref:ComF family protein n=1 Tax=Mycolicibacterium obuense TaxID=1807 RepID=A0A0M2JUX9_9MYCO|nr:ComF family protein [Mycolicibacterium obuense]KKE98378.1 phosphoribosyltransferase [Mycolicibacterium obuense]TDL10014.1 ComF family protein [Mycolicibacterium obuense]